MAWSLLQSVSTAATATGATSVSATFTTANLSSGSVVIAAFAAAAATASAPTTPTATCGGTSMTLIGQITPNGGAGIASLVALFALATPAGQVGTKPTVTGSWTNSATASIIVEEVSGIVATVDGTAATKAQNTTGVSPATCNAYSSTASNEYLVSVYGDDGGPATLGTNSTGYTADANNVSANSHADVGLWHKNSANGAETMSLALTGTVPVWGTILAAFPLVPIGATLTTPNIALAAPLLGFNVPLTTPNLALGAPALYIPYHGLRAELYTGAWQDISTYVYQRDTVGLQRGRPDEASTMSTATATFTLNNRDGRFTTRNPGGAYYPNLVQNSPVRFSKLAADAGLPQSYLRLEADSTSSAATPDSVGLQITGPLDVRVDYQPSDYSGSNLAMKFGATAKSWMFGFRSVLVNDVTVADGTLQFEWFDGAQDHFVSSTVPIPYYNQRIALRAQFTPSTGTTIFYTAPSMAGPWTQLGATVVTGATTLANGAGQSVQIGGTNNRPGWVPGVSLLGSVYEFQLLSNAVLVADPVFSAQPPGVTSFRDVQGNTWSLTGTAEISDRLYRFHGEMGSYPKAADPSATDVYSMATAYGPSRRLQNSNTPAYSPWRRAIIKNAASLQLVDYWPAEDGSTASTIGSAFGGQPLAIAGNGVPSFASNSAFVASNPIPVMNGGTFYGTVTTPAGYTWTDNVFQFFWEVPSGDDTNGAVAFQMTTTGTCALINVVYGTGGNLTLNVYRSSGALIGSQSLGAGSIPLGKPCLVTVYVQASPAQVTVLVQPGGSTSASGPVVSFAGTVGQVTGWQAGGGLTGSAMGQFAVSGLLTALSFLNLADHASPLTAWSGEPAAARFSRICAEEGIACRIVGAQALSVPMGVQSLGTVWSILQQCENTDLGMIFEPRQCNGLGYRTRQSLYHQTPLATASYSAGQVFQGFGSTGDTQMAVNDVTAQAPSGSVARQQLLAGTMSVQSPPAGIGRVDTQINPAPKFDQALNQLASWYLNVRSVDDDRYPSIPFQMARSLTPTAIALLDIGDYLQITNTPSWEPPGPVRQLTAGIAETYFPGTLWEIDINGIPESPYETAQLGVMHLSPGTAQLTSAVTTVATTFQVTTVTGPVWTQAGGDFPFDILVDGERMTVTNITSATSPQTFTVTRSVNGVVKAHNPGALVTLYKLSILGL